MTHTVQARLRKPRRRGFSLVGFLFVMVVLALLGVLGAQALPTVIEYQAVLKAVDKARQGNTIPEVRQLFDKAAVIEDISSIAGKDLEVVKDGDIMRIKFAYNREIHMFGPAWLTLKYAGQSKTEPRRT
jgi:sensor histidine kinase regulating citrate/malate metabolism